MKKVPWRWTIRFLQTSILKTSLTCSHSSYSPNWRKPSTVFTSKCTLFAFHSCTYKKLLYILFCTVHTLFWKSFSGWRSHVQATTDGAGAPRCGHTLQLHASAYSWTAHRFHPIHSNTTAVVLSSAVAKCRPTEINLRSRIFATVTQGNVIARWKYS